jgi:hypothetical protein
MQDEPERRGLFPIQDEASAVVSGILISDEVNLDRSRRLPRPLLWQGGRSPPSAKADKDALLFGASYMRRARILLGEVSEEWKRIFVAIADANRDLEICGYVDKPVDLLLEMNALKPDAVVISVLAVSRTEFTCLRKGPKRLFRSLGRAAASDCESMPRRVGSWRLLFPIRGERDS